MPRWSTSWPKRPTTGCCPRWWPATAASTCYWSTSLGYVSVDQRRRAVVPGLTEREERASVATSSNHPFSEWGQTFSDPRLATAVVDRLTFGAHIIETGTDSYRLRLSRAK
ncbi:MAG TPA: ATP-binding protein [Acidimicrobiales bacterium]|nr:ATP-binding protein [Acidimicrobiales bacterium]